jgi:hypothetical protein
MAKRLPPITELTACPHCGGDEFYVVQRYKGTGNYNRRFDGGSADNTTMYDCLKEVAGKIAFCVDCNVALARWDQEANNDLYVN